MIGLELKTTARLETGQSGGIRIQMKNPSSAAAAATTRMNKIHPAH